MEYIVTTPLTKEKIKDWKAGDTILLTGEIYTARDTAHSRMFQALEQGQPLPFTLKDACIYYSGPTPAPEGHVIGSAGPTTAGRMDAYTPRLLDEGLSAMIGKGGRTPQVEQAIQRNGCVYLGFIGGAGALAAACIEESHLVAYEDLGTEAVRRLVVKNFPLTVLIDSRGENLYQTGPKAYRDSLKNTLNYSLDGE